MNRSLFSKSSAEFIGTFALVFAGCGAIMIGEPISLNPIAVPLVFGLVIATMIYAVGHISGAHFNPAVTIAFAISRHFPKKQILPYLLAQYLGGLVAMSLLVILIPEAEHFGATIPQTDLWRAFIWEIVLSFFLMFVIISVATDTRAAGMMAGLAIGGVVMLCALLGGSITGASMNPARSFAPNVFALEWRILWLYTLAPVIGAILAAITYERIRCENLSNSDASIETADHGCC